MASSQNREDKQHIILLPFMAQGHLNPIMALAGLLELRTNHTITIVNTPLNIRKLKAALPPESAIHLAELPFNSSDHGLPSNCENTDSVPPHLILRLIQASETLQPAFEIFLANICGQDGRPPLCIISDEFMSWSVESARKFDIFHCVAGTGGGYGTAIFLSVWKHLPHKKTDSEIIALPDFPGINLHRTQLTRHCKEADGSDPWSILFRKHMEFFYQTDGMVINTIEELEGRALNYFRNEVSRRIWCVGPLLRSLFSPSSSTTSSSCTDWLNQHTPNSVLYISFGSQNSIQLSHMKELAKGLEASGKPFIWVVKPPIGFDVKGDFRAEWFPDGFEERVTAKKRQGLLAKSWAPQMEILSHKSTGAFLSHCGWNSILESLKEGVPIIGWPMAAEQHYNMKYLVDELGVGVEIARGLEVEIHGDDITKMIKHVMDQESGIGVEMRRKAKEVQELIEAATVEDENCKGSSVRALDEFLQTAASHRTK
ncbi:UDP-glycosyltransferase 92A1-like [Aristolochia californica]|uniref:UDP-glycosyltransferase 92A1-like n=1 Tax=Aristolochia californica TaxID=171875 RepID=UPI0035E021A7